MCALGVEIRDAREIMSRELFDSYKAVGRFALFSDVFRLQLQLQEKGVWVDLDCFLVKPLRPAGEYVFGILVPGKLNGAVLGLPAKSAMALGTTLAWNCDVGTAPAIWMRIFLPRAAVASNSIVCGASMCPR